MRDFFIAVGLTLLALPACALDAELHKIYTERAARLYVQQCHGKVIGKQGETIAQGTFDEDADHSIGNMWIRGTNWHFYNRGNQYEVDIASPVVKVLDRVFTARITDFDRTIGKIVDASDHKNIYNKAGRVLHYIQDMSVPSHVVPVFHYKFLGAGVIDKVDGYKLSENEMCEVEATIEFDCKAESHDADYPYRLLDASAGDTLDAIKGKVSVIQGKQVMMDRSEIHQQQLAVAGFNENPKEMGWGNFWCYDAMDGYEQCRKSGEKGFFGIYGSLGNSFGETTIPYHCNLLTLDEALDEVMLCDTVEVDEGTYKEFYKRRYKRIIEDTLKFFAYSESKVTGRLAEIGAGHDRVSVVSQMGEK
jgi:hypothetical protein